jgi:hypothetical protein
MLVLMLPSFKLVLAGRLQPVILLMTRCTELIIIVLMRLLVVVLVVDLLGIGLTVPPKAALTWAGIDHRRWRASSHDRASSATSAADDNDGYTNEENE